MLTYSLCWESGLETLPSAISTSMNGASFGKILIEFLDLNENSLLDILLDHEYKTQTTQKLGMGLCFTKGNDRKLYNAVRAANQHLDLESQLHVVMVRFTKTISYYSDGPFRCDHEPDWEENESEETIDIWADENGKKVTDWDDFEMSDIEVIAKDKETSDWGDVDWGDVEDMAYDGPNMTGTYHRYAMVIDLTRNEVQIVLEEEEVIDLTRDEVQIMSEEEVVRAAKRKKMMEVVET